MRCLLRIRHLWEINLFLIFMLVPKIRQLNNNFYLYVA